ncbi:MAG: SDR family oxidoreductase [Myxococcales bacterium]
MSDKRRTYFVTGFPGFIGRRLVQHIARRHPDARIYLLVQPKFVDDARKLAKSMKGADLQLLQGDIVDMHLGLSSEEYARLCDEVTDIFHLAAIYYLGVPKEVARRVNVEGTRNVIELARDCKKLKRFSHFSTAFVSGDREGVIAEDELDMHQSFRNIYEETKFQAEKLVRRAMKDVPTCIFRPSIVVGDSRTGEIDRFDGPYYLGILLVTSPLTVPLPLPGNGVAPLNVVPVDYVVEAALAISDDPRATGRTFHLVDPNPMSSRKVYELIAERTNKKLPRVTLPARAAEALLRFPVLEKLYRPQRAAISYVNHLAIYNSYNTLELLDGTGIRCPPLTTYLDKLVDFVRNYYRQRREEAAAVVEDPLDQPAQDRALAGE